MGVATATPLIKVSKSRLRNREASFEDYPQIAALQLQNGLITRPYEDWVSLWKCNPVYEKLGGRTPIGWVLEKEDGQIVGSIANIPLTYQLEGRELYAAAACAWVVDPLYRGYSMSLLSRLTQQKDVDLVVSTTVSFNAEPALRVFQWSKAPGNWRKSAFWITDYQGFVKSVLIMKSVPLADVFRYPVSAALFCRDKFKDGRQ